MKKLLSAIWAKALAFLLTPLAGVAAVNGVSEVIMVYFYDVWSPHPVWLLVVTVLCAGDRGVAAVLPGGGGTLAGP